MSDGRGLWAAKVRSAGVLATEGGAIGGPALLLLLVVMGVILLRRGGVGVHCERQRQTADA